MLPELSLYIHIPWCIKKCPYCDFNSHAVKSELPEAAYIDCLLEDLAHDIQRWQIDRPLRSIFIGGGTPSLFSPEAFARLLDGIQHTLQMSTQTEITLEANPGTFESQKFKEFRALGINRLSIGIQSFNNQLLTQLGRVHNGTEAFKAAEIAHEAGFDNFNLDLMFGLPHADISDTLNDIATAIRLEPSHISSYQLTLEPNTFFHSFPPTLPDEVQISSTLLQSQALLAQAGYQQYEVSAYSKPGKQSYHNQHYWTFGDYLGIGAGAHGKITQAKPDKIVRTSKPKHPTQYLLLNHSHTSVTTIPVAELPLEFLMNQLRLRQGFTLAHYQRQTGLNPSSLEPGLSRCLAENLLIQNADHFTCSEQGWNFLDTLLEKFIP